VIRLRRPRSWIDLVRRLAAAALALGALVLAARPPSAPEATPDGPATVGVVVAGRDLPAGTVLGKADLRVARLPPEAVPDGVAASPDQLAGRPLAGALRAGEPVTDVRLVGPGLTAALPAGRVAAPVRLADLAVAALVQAGDRVDVLATAPGAIDAEVVAAGALVLAPSTPGDDSSAGDAPTGLLLLEVDPATAGRLAAAAVSATLTVTLAPP
jgi:pilus assembly protein CpaB